MWKWRLFSCVQLDLYSPRHPPGQNTGVGSFSLPQGIFPTQGLNPGLPHFRQILYQLSHKGSPRILKRVAYSLIGYPLQYSWLENPMMEEPGKLQSMGLQRVGHDWATELIDWLDHRRGKGIPEKHHFSFIDYDKAFDCVDHNKLKNS